MDCWPQVTHTHTKNHPAGLTKWTDSTLRWRSTAYENSWKSECFLNGACSLRYNKNHYKNKSLTSFWHGPWNECTTDVMHCSLKKGSSKLTTNLHSTSGMSVCPVRKHAVQVKVSIDAPERQRVYIKETVFSPDDQWGIGLEKNVSNLKCITCCYA